MFPVGDFNFAICGFATFAATVGYACSRRYTSHPIAPTPQVLAEQLGHTVTNQSPDSVVATEDKSPVTSQDMTSEESEATDLNEMVPIVATPAVNVEAPSSSLERRSSLKRKRAEDDDYSKAGYPFNLLSIYPPAKRSRTPPSDRGDDESNENDKVIVNVPITQVQDENTVEDPKTDNGLEDLPSLTSSPRSVITDDAPITPPNESLPLPPSPKKSFSELATPSLPSTPPSQKRHVPISSGFTAFAGKGSPFGSPRFSAASSAFSAKPAWCQPSKASDIQTLGSSSYDDSQPEAAIAPAEIPFEVPHAHVTGEEDEDVELEMKNIKLFVKRGKKNFSEGMVGHLKLLSNKSTHNQRLLFRREPLWKVSMNVRLHPSVRYTYDTEERVLRVVLAEPIETPGVSAEQWPREIVVYAFKPGRGASKADFKEFAEALIARSSLASTSST